MIIYFNGTSSSGKSSIAIELQSLMEEPVFYFSIDTILYSLSKEILKEIQSNKESLISHERWNQIFKGYFDCLKALSDAGNTVIGDCPIHLDFQIPHFQKAISPIKDKIVIGLNCSLGTLNEREIARGDRSIGLAERQFSTIHRYLDYDLELDSEFVGPVDHAKFILNKIKRR